MDMSSWDHGDGIMPARGTFTEWHNFLQYKPGVIQGALGTTQYVHLDVPVNSFTVEKRLHKARLPVCYINKSAVEFEDTKDLDGKRGYLLSFVVGQPVQETFRMYIPLERIDQYCREPRQVDPKGSRIS